MARKDRSDSVLDGLPTERKEKLIAWLVDENIAYTDAVSRVWEKFGVKTSVSALQRFYATKCFKLVASQASEFADLVASQAAADPAKFDEATIALVKQKAFERAYAKNGNLSELATLAGILGDSAKIELKRQELALRESQQSLRLRQYEDKIAAARASLERAKSKGGLSVETRELIEQQLALL